MIELIDDTGITEQSTLIGLNPRSVRFSESHWYKPGIDVTIGGLGGLGSYLALYLSRQECTIYSYEMDTVSEVNIGSQLYGVDAIGELKSTATSNLLKKLSGNDTFSSLGEFDNDSWVTPFTFSCFDNMKARRLMFNKWKLHNNPNKIFIDGRLLMEVAQIYAVTPDRIEQYETTLFEDSVIDDEPCSMKATSHCGAIAAGYMIAAFNNHIANLEFGMNIRTVPFNYTFELPLFTHSKT